jgi:hypothetical protein
MKKATALQLRKELKSKDTKHPVLQRLKKSVFQDCKSGVVITSYDRMHHRHNRS